MIIIKTTKKEWVQKNILSFYLEELGVSLKTAIGSKWEKRKQDKIAT